MRVPLNTYEDVHTYVKSYVMYGYYLYEAGLGQHDTYLISTYTAKVKHI